MTNLDSSRLEACHWMMLRLAGFVPDELVTQCREWLGQGRALDVGRAITFAVLSAHLRLHEDDVDLLAELLAADGADTSALSMVKVVDTDPLPMYGFAPTRARVDLEIGVAADSKPGEMLTQAEPEDDLDRAALAAAKAVGVTRGVWRAWRYPGDGAPWPRPRRVWVLETNRGADLVGVAATVQHAVMAAGEASAQVEVYPVCGELPSYQRLARAYGALLWACAPDPGVRIAPVFDRVDRAGPAMAPDHAVLASAELGPVAAYLRAGELLVMTPALMDDVVDPAWRQVVSMNLRTDGHWVWCEASAYYLERYQLAPDAGLLDHMRAHAFAPPQVDGPGVYRALAALQRPNPFSDPWPPV